MKNIPILIKKTEFINDTLQIRTRTFAKVCSINILLLPVEKENQASDDFFFLFSVFPAFSDLMRE